MKVCLFTYSQIRVRVIRTRERILDTNPSTFKPFDIPQVAKLFLNRANTGMGSLQFQSS